MAKVKDKAAIAARKRDRKAGLLEYTSTVSVKATPAPKVNPIVATLKTSEENAKHTAQDVALGIEYFNGLSDAGKTLNLQLPALKIALREAVMTGDFGIVLVINHTLVGMWMNIRNEATADNKALAAKLRVKALYEAVDFITNQFIAGKMRWWIAKSHLNNHFDLGIPVTLPRANARVGVN